MIDFLYGAIAGIIFSVLITAGQGTVLRPGSQRHRTVPRPAKETGKLRSSLIDMLSWICSAFLIYLSYRGLS